MTSRAVCFLAVLLSLGGTAAGKDSDFHEAAVEPVAMPPPSGRLVVGERISYHGRWFALPVGHGWIEVKELTTLNGRAAYLIEAQGHTNDVLSKLYPIHDTLKSYIDAETLRPLQFEKYQREGRYRADEIVTFDYERLIATYRSLLNGSVKEVPIPADVQDLLSTFYWLRTQVADPSRGAVLNIYSDEKVFRTEFEPLQTVTLELLKRGTFQCLVMEPKAEFKGVFVKRGRVLTYVRADARRLPLLIRITTPWGPITGVIDADSLNPPEAKED